MTNRLTKFVKNSMPTRDDQTLFRPDAIQSSGASWLGPIRLGSPVHHHVYAVIALFVTLAIILLLIFGHYTRHLAVTGILVPSQGLLTISAPISGTVEKVLVHSGEKVRAGAPLLEIASNPDNPSVGLVATIIEQSINAEKRVLSGSLSAARSVSLMQQTALRDKLQLLQAQLAETSAEIAIQHQDINSTEKVLREFMSVRGRGLVSDPELQQQHLTVYSAETQLEGLERQRTELAQNISSATHQLGELPLTSLNQENTIRSKLETLRQELAKTAGSNVLLIRAPANGIVSAMTVNPGQAIAAGQPVLSVMPAGDPLRAQLLVSSQAIGFLTVGGTVALHYAAFPYRDFGTFHGTVRSISGSALTPAEIAALTGAHSTVPLYRIMVQLHRTTVEVHGRQKSLRAGMQLHAEITLNRLRLIQWVFEPLYGLGHDLFPNSRHADHSAAAPSPIIAQPSLP